MKKMLLAALVLSVSGIAHADVTLKVTDNIELLAANEQKPELEGGFFASEKSLILPNGESQILFRYRTFFDKGNDRVIVESDPIIATFNASDQALTFQLPKYRNERQAESEIKNFEWSMLDTSGQSLDVKQDKLVKKGMQIGRDYRTEISLYNQKGGPAAWSKSVATVHPVTLPAKIQKAEMAKADTAEEMLHFWYEKADEKTKARFKAFINQQ